MAMGPFFPAEERLEFANPTTVFYHEELRILAGRKHTQDSNVFGYVLAFDWMVSCTARHAAKKKEKKRRKLFNAIATIRNKN